MSEPDLQNFDAPGDGASAACVDEMEHWIVDRLRALTPGRVGARAPVSIEPFRGLLKVRTAGRLFYFKAVREIHRHEQSLTCLLARLFPAHFPEVVAADDRNGWLLMSEVEGTPLDDLYEPRYFEGALRDFAKIQIGCIEHATTLLDGGAQDYRLESLGSNLESCFESLSACDTPDAEIRRLKEQIEIRTLTERLAERCERVKREGLPPTLGHGDLHFGNIFAKPDRYVFIDLAEGYVGHPFFTALEYFSAVKRDRGVELARIPALRAAYLEPWSEMLRVDGAHLVKLLDLSRPLGMFRIVMRLGQCYREVEAIRQDPELTTAYLTRVWGVIRSMDRVLGTP